MNRPEIASCALIALLIATSPLLAQPAADDPLLADDLQLLREARVRTDGPGLLTFFREHTVRPEQRLKAAALIPQLGSDRFAARERASHLLTRLGQAAREPLGLALTDSDAEVRRRARVCLADIEDGERVSLATAAARVLASRPAAGAAAVLLDYLPYAPDESVESDVVAALLGICRDPAFRDMALSRALSDPEPIRRAAAAQSLGWGDDAERAAVRKALADPHPKVRLLAAEALLVHADPAALDALIEMLAAAPFDHAAQAEDLLLTAAGSTAPKIRLEASPSVRAKCAAAWRLWRRDSSVAVKSLEIDSLLMPPARRALAISRQFFQALSDGKVATARSLAVVPFCVDEDDSKAMMLTTAKELSEFIDDINESFHRDGFRWAPFGPVENSLVCARREPRRVASKPVASKPGIDFKPDVWVCPFRISSGRRDGEALVRLYIRMRGAKGVVIGLSAEER